MLFLLVYSVYIVCSVELSFKAGDEVMLLGYKDSGNRWKPVS